MTIALLVESDAYAQEVFGYAKLDAPYTVRALSGFTAIFPALEPRRTSRRPALFLATAATTVPAIHAKNKIAVESGPFTLEMPRSW